MTLLPFDLGGVRARVYWPSGDSFFGSKSALTRTLPVFAKKKQIEAPEGAPEMRDSFRFFDFCRRVFIEDCLR